MFAIYDTQGRYFRNALEELRRVRKPPATQALSLPTGDAEHSPQEPVSRDASQPISPRSIQAYREARQVSKREAIVHAYQVMSQPVATVPITFDTASALQLFRDLNYQQLPVLDERHRPVGMLSERDLLKLVVIDHGTLTFLQGKTVADAMSPEVITADPVTDLRRIARAMLDYRLGAMPIVDERDTLVGLVSRSDILRGVSQDPPLSLWT